jgi:hypothetical protein
MSPAVLVLLSAAVPLAGGQPSQPQVSVDLTDVASALAARLRLDESQVPLSMLVPREVAAEACGVPASRLPSDGCKARAASTQFEALLVNRMRADEVPAEAPPIRP